ncbi:MAG: CYCXC family (seleno)protein [Thermodesulfobacteriota bacterium]
MEKKKEKVGLKSPYIVGVAILVILGFGGGYLLSINRGGFVEGEITGIAELRGGETRETMSPAHFTGRVAKAYRAAREIPEVLDSLYCYCECKKHFGHKSLLSCYVDMHGAYCDVCIDEAIMAYDMHQSGKDILSIRRAIDKRFAS